jgi:hypothetical protein
LLENTNFGISLAFLDELSALVIKNTCNTPPALF